MFELPQDLQYNSPLKGQGYNEMVSQANNKGMNPWALMELSKMQKQQQVDLDNAADRGAGMKAKVESDLASKGGLSSGARERANEEGAKNYLSMASDIGRTGTMGKLNLGIQDELQKQKMLEGVTNMQMQDVNAHNMFDQNQYNQKMSAWAAKQQADATRDASKKGPFG